MRRKHEMRKNCFSKKCNYLTPPPPPTHTWEQKSEQGNGGYIGYIFPLSLSHDLLSGETTFHLTQCLNSLSTIKNLEKPPPI